MADNGGCEKREEKRAPGSGLIPLVSVVVPVYNGAETLPLALDSALKQEVDLEVLVVDDGSTDGTAAVMERYRDDPRVRYEKNQKNLGAAGSRNRGVAMARGKYVAFLDSDDCWAPGKLKKQLALLADTGSVLCCTGRELLTPQGNPTGRVIGVKPVISRRDLLGHNSINCSSVLLDASVAREFPMEHEDSHEDYITWLKILDRYGPAVGIDEPLLKYRLSSGGKSGSKLKSAAMTFRVYRYMGFGRVRSAVCFVSYALHGVCKYAGAFLTGPRSGR